MSNVLATCSIVCKEGLAVLENMLGFSQNVNRDFESEFNSNASRGYATGNTVNIRRPPRYTYRAGRIATPQATVESTIPLTLSQGGTDLSFTSNELTTSITSQRMQTAITAAMVPIANQIDAEGLQLAHYATFNTLNPTGALPTSQALSLQAMTQLGQRLNEMGAPVRDNNRALIMNPAFNAAMIQGMGGFFNNPSKISKQFDTGMLTDSFGFAVAMDQNVDVHTNGAATATNINGAGQTGSTITVSAVAGGTLTRGTTITLPGVFAVNPVSRQSTGQLANYVVTADVAAGATSIPISPAIITSGAFQNATASPTTGSPYVILGSASTNYSTNVAYHKDAFTLAMVPLWMPPKGQGVIDVAQESHNGFTMRAMKYIDGTADNMIMRLDVLFGWAAPYPELACKYYTV